MKVDGVGSQKMLQGLLTFNDLVVQVLMLDRVEVMMGAYFPGRKVLTLSIYLHPKQGPEATHFHQALVAVFGNLTLTKAVFSTDTTNANVAGC